MCVFQLGLDPEQGIKLFDIRMPFKELSTQRVVTPTMGFIWRHDMLSIVTSCEDKQGCVQIQLIGDLSSQSSPCNYLPGGGVGITR